MIKINLCDQFQQAMPQLQRKRSDRHSYADEEEEEDGAEVQGDGKV